MTTVRPVNGLCGRPPLGYAPDPAPGSILLADDWINLQLCIATCRVD